MPASDHSSTSNTSTSKQWKHTLVTALLGLLLAVVAAGTATYAWYIYNAKVHTTSLRMAAGTTAVLEIANSYGGPYGLSTSLSEFTGLLNPVSTNTLLLDYPLSAEDLVSEDHKSKNFCKVLGFTNNSENHLIARWFGAVDYQDYYATTLYLRTRGSSTDVYIANINYTDSDTRNPISSAIRLGLVVHKPGQNDEAEKDFIYAINPDTHVQTQDYNTYSNAGSEGNTVLDVAQYPETIGTGTFDTLTTFDPCTPDNYCNYDKDTGDVTLKENSLKLCTLPYDTDTKTGTPVRIDLYIWLEGCDPDCTNELMAMTLKDISISFAGKPAVNVSDE